LYLIGQLVLRVNDATAQRAVIVAIAVATVGVAVPLHLGTFAAITLGTFVATTMGDQE
jgi:hypothetical protein